MARTRINPTAFVSYSWDSPAHKQWVSDLAERLRRDGVDIKLDQWETAPGDQLPAFMEAAVRDNEFVLIVCTENYKAKSDNRKGGVGYEGDIMTSEVFTKGNHRKYIPVLRARPKEQSVPTWLQGKYYVDLSSDPYAEEQYSDLRMTLLGSRPTPPPLRSLDDDETVDAGALSIGIHASEVKGGPIRILGIVIDEVSEPSNDGSQGSALYRVPFKLSAEPDDLWDELFVRNWDDPPSFTTMHRPGIGFVSGDEIILDGTTIEEVGTYHKKTLKLVVDETNRQHEEIMQKRKSAFEAEQARSQEHRRQVRDAASRISFED